MNELSDISRALIGGVFLGISSSLLLYFKGRIFGISGFIGFSIENFSKSRWRLIMLFSLILGGSLNYFFIYDPNKFYIYRPISLILLGGFLVGYGTRLGGGCTSGHGICGISRLSPRSLIATLSFMISGFLAVTFIRIFTLGL